METTTLTNIYNEFDKSINWNAFLYVFQKLMTVVLTFIFYKNLASQEFSVWANINSIIFLVLLWIDFGFRKSVPKYISYFSKTKKSHLTFTKLLFKIQTGSLILAVFFLVFYLKKIAWFIGINLSNQILYLSLIIFMYESYIAFFKLLYHSHFWNKYFNLLHSIITFFETIAYLFVIFYFKTISLENIFLIKILANFSTVVVSGIYLNKLYLCQEYKPSQNNIDIPSSKGFIKHSIIMWYNCVLKSLGERNFVIPLLTFHLGPEFSNIFKIANDWALLFQRTILKTIGTTDTSLFAYTNQVEKSLMQNAFNKIISKISRICIPLFGLLILFISNKNYFIGSNKMIFHTFLLLVLIYIVESFLSPFERLLEVNKNYSILVLSYLPYLAFLVLIAFKQYLPLIGFWSFIFIIYFIKLVNLIVLVMYSKRKYKIKIENLF